MSQCNVNDPRNSFGSCVTMHVIHLRRPWSIIADNNKQIDQVDVPEINPLLAEDSLEHCYCRKFNATPAVLNSKVVLRLSGYHGCLTDVRLNQQSISFDCQSSGFVTVALTGYLRPHNELKLTIVRYDDQCPRLTGDVVLEVSG